MVTVERTAVSATGGRTHLQELLEERARQWPSAVALGGEEGLIWRTVDSRELLTLVEGVAERLAELGVCAGDRVVTWLPNGWRTPIFLFAVWTLDAVVVPFDREMNTEAARTIVTSVTPKLILTGYDDLPAWATADQLTSWWEPASPSAAPAPVAGGRDGGTAGGESRNPAIPRSRHQGTGAAGRLAAIFFTSGTTGAPKGCMITHRNLLSQVHAFPDRIPLEPGDRLAGILPLSHLFELTTGLLYPLSRGATIHYVPSRRGPDVLRVFNEQKITHVIGVPQLLGLLGKALEDQLRAKLPGPAYRALVALADRSPMAVRRRLYWPVHRKLGGHLTMMASGGAALSVGTHRLWERTGVRVIQGYGASECSPVIACGTADGSTPIGTVGKPIPGTEVRTDAAGELFVQGPGVMLGYWNDPAKTAEVLHDGWYATGDLVTIDAEGNITIAGRAKDLIVLPSGLNVWPQDIEDALRQHPAVKDASVVAVPSQSGGATLHAYLLPQVDYVDPAPIVATTNSRLAVHQRLASASWWPEPDFPRTSTLKVRRNLLKPPTDEQLVRVDATLAADDPVTQAVVAVSKRATVAPAQSLAELGLDSLALEELALALEEKTGKRVAEGVLSGEQTVGEVKAIVAGLPSLDEADDPHAATVTTGEPPLWPYRWGKAFRVFGRPVDILYRYGVTKVVVLGLNRLHDLPPRVILAGTHRSYADFVALRAILRATPAGRILPNLISAAAADGLQGAGPLAHWAIAALGLYPLRRKGDTTSSLRGLVKAAGDTGSIMIFPQGHHVDAARERAGDPAVDFRSGVGLLAKALKIPVVPFGVAGTEHLVPPDIPPDFKGLVIGGIAFDLKRGPIAYAFGEPMSIGATETPEAFTARLQTACYALTRAAEAALERRQGK